MNTQLVRASFSPQQTLQLPRNNKEGQGKSGGKGRGVRSWSNSESCAVQDGCSRLAEGFESRKDVGPDCQQEFGELAQWQTCWDPIME